MNKIITNKGMWSDENLYWNLEALENSLVSCTGNVFGDGHVTAGPIHPHP
jgi:hypothetical protein